MGALGGQYGRRSTPRQLRVHRSTPRQLRVEVRLAVLGNCSETERSASCALPHRAQSSVRVNAQLSSPTCSSTNRPIRGTSIGHPTPRKTRALASSHRRSLPRLRRRRRLGRRHARSLSDQHSSAHQRACSRYQAPCSQATPWSSQPTCGRPTLAESSEAQGGQPLYAVSTHRLPASPSMSHRRAMVGPTKTSSCHSTSSEWLPSSRPDFPPASPCGNREFWADVPHRNRDHRAYGAVRRVHSFFPYNVTDARKRLLTHEMRFRSGLRTHRSAFTSFGPNSTRAAGSNFYKKGL